MNSKSILFIMASLLLCVGVYTVFVFIQAPAEQAVVDSPVDLVITERAFLEVYIPHQEAAAAAARQLLENEIRLRPLHDIATKIAEEMTTESDYLQAQYLSVYGIPYTATGEYQSLLRPLSELAETERERIFLEDMIRQYELSIELAERGLTLSLSKTVAAQVQKNLASAQVEILNMREVLRLLPQ